MILKSFAFIIINTYCWYDTIEFYSIFFVFSNIFICYLCEIKHTNRQW